MKMLDLKGCLLHRGLLISEQTAPREPSFRQSALPGVYSWLKTLPNLSASGRVPDLKPSRLIRGFAVPGSFSTLVSRSEILHLPSRCDSAKSCRLATSDWHSRLCPVVALRLNGRFDFVATELRSNVMRQPRTPVRGIRPKERWSCEATACVARMLDHGNSEGGFEHEHEHRYAEHEHEYEYDCWDRGWHERIPAWGFAGKSRDSLRLHPCAWMQIRNLRVRSECVMSPLAVGMAWGWTGYAARGTSRELL